MSSKLKKLVDEAKENGEQDLDLSDRNIQNINEVPGLRKPLSFINDIGKIELSSWLRIKQISSCETPREIEE